MNFEIRYPITLYNMPNIPKTINMDFTDRDLIFKAVIIMATESKDESIVILNNDN